LNGQESFYETLSAAISDMVEHGFDSVERVEGWMRLLREAARRSLKSETELEQVLRETLASVYRRLVDRGEIAKFHKGAARFTLERIRPSLRAELDRRIMASTSLITLNREESVEKTLRRFAGWSTSIPKGGTEARGKQKAKDDIRKSLGRLPFEERRVVIDQSHKLRASLSEIMATDGGAIAGIWRSHWRQKGYDYREDHKERDLEVYAMKGNWALEKGLMKVGPAGYYQDITSAGEEPFCRCYVTWIYHVADLPANMVTVKGRAEMARVKEERAA
jgi:DNA-directed RNA polymerase specialized sigma24 family protein